MITIETVVRYRTSDGSTHATMEIAQRHEKSVAEKMINEKSALALAQKRWPDMKTTEQSYNCGYNSGFSWKWDHHPGGPFVHKIGMRITRDLVWEAYAKQSQRNNEAWRHGWHEGLVDQFKALGKPLPEWYRPR